MVVAYLHSFISCMHGYIGIHFLSFVFPAFLFPLGLISHCIIIFVYFGTDEHHSTVIETSGSVFLLVFASVY